MTQWSLTTGDDVVVVDQDKYFKDAFRMWRHCFAHTWLWCLATVAERFFPSWNWSRMSSNPQWNRTGWFVWPCSVWNEVRLTGNIVVFHNHRYYFIGTATCEFRENTGLIQTCVILFKAQIKHKFIYRMTYTRTHARTHTHTYITEYSL